MNDDIKGVLDRAVRALRADWIFLGDPGLDDELRCAEEGIAWAELTALGIEPDTSKPKRCAMDVAKTVEGSMMGAAI